MTLKEFYKKYDGYIKKLIIEALKEDCYKGDISTQLVLNSKQQNKYYSARLLCKEDCVAAGIDLFIRVFKLVNNKTKVKQYFKDGQFVRKNSIVLEIQAPLKTLLSCERTALNIIQRMSGIATLTNKFVQMLKYKDSRILHTRKTTPNFRLFELASVKIGGGDFYRDSLKSSVMIKDNHVIAAGSILNAIKNFRLYGKKRKHFTTIEVKGIKQVKEVCLHGKGLINRVMLDNFKRKFLKEAVFLLKSAGFEIELSGGINLENFKQMQYPGIDFYSLGCITHSYKSVDFSLEF